jgi:hypothetical protein
MHLAERAPLKIVQHGRRVWWRGLGGPSRRSQIDLPGARTFSILSLIKPSAPADFVHLHKNNLEIKDLEA